MISLDYRDSRPIYQQVKDALRRRMVTGVLAAGDKLPSVRALAGELAINPNTIARAYTELEQEGYIVTVTGKGTFVADGNDQHRARKAELESRLQPIAAEWRSLGGTREEWAQLWEGGNDHA